MKPGLLIVVSGPAGVGKGSVIKRVRELTDEVTMSVSATSREPRPGEISGVSYFFVTREEFEEMIKKGSLIEWVEYCCNYYGTPREFVSMELEKGHNIVLEIDVKGSMRIKELFPESILCFIAPPSFKELTKRLRERKTEDEDAIRKRLLRAREELDFVGDYDYVIINDKIEKAARDFIGIVRTEQMRTSRNKEIIENMKYKETDFL